MLKKFNKLIAVIVLLIIIWPFLMPSFAIAVSEYEGTKTAEENVNFDINFDGKDSNSANIKDGSSINIIAKVFNSGYLKDIRIAIDDSNFNLGTSENKALKSINDNLIELNEIKAGDNVNLSIPIILNKTEKIDENEFNKENKFTLSAIYVNEKGKEKKISKIIKKFLSCDEIVESKINQKLIRYLKYQDKTIMSFEVEDGIIDNFIPVINKKISVIVPNIDSKEQSKVIVSGDKLTIK